MNNDLISKTPGAERMLFGGIVLGLGFAIWQGLRYELGTIGKGLVFGGMAFGAVQIFRGLWAWKYTDREAFAASRARQNLLIDVPLIHGKVEMLNAIEDALILQFENSQTVNVEMQSIDWANQMATIHLTGKNADAIYANAVSTLSSLAGPNLVLFPKPGMPIDTEINGKRLLVGLPGRKVT